MYACSPVSHRTGEQPQSGCAARRTLFDATYRGALFGLVVLAGSSGCSTMHVKRATYQMLRQNDCRINQLDDFCHRNFTADYHEYERVRQDFMRRSVQPGDPLDALLDNAELASAGPRIPTL